MKGLIAQASVLTMVRMQKMCFSFLSTVIFLSKRFSSEPIYSYFIEEKLAL